MSSRYYTIGLAGHIDHGKTTLTKALTNVDTDRLIEEKKRKISIELGYAPFLLDEFETTIIDVPGHEKFIRQMIAGVAGIDLVILVIAADEGVMPQTKEHIEILSFLGIQHGIIALTKTDRIQSESLKTIKREILESVNNTIFEKTDIVYVDSIKRIGLEELKTVIKKRLGKIPPKNSYGPFRLPIDQVFTLDGQGVIVRGTIYEGTVKKGDSLSLLPLQIPVKVKQLQVHNNTLECAVAGKRVAINITGVPKASIKRGFVLVTPNEISPTNTIDVLLKGSKNLKSSIQQRSLLKFHTSTTEVMGRVIFFDRNELLNGDEVLCQIRLEEPVLVKREDRFVIRRPSPVETIGGGWVIDPFGQRYRFGSQTIQMLERKKVGSPEERIIETLCTYGFLKRNELLKLTFLHPILFSESITILKEQNQLHEIIQELYTSNYVYNHLVNSILEEIKGFHLKYPLRIGLTKAVCIQTLSNTYPRNIIEVVIEQEAERGTLIKNNKYLWLPGFQPHVPKTLASQLEYVLDKLKVDGLQVNTWDNYGFNARIPIRLQHDLREYLLDKQIIYPWGDKRVIHSFTFNQLLIKIYKASKGCTFGIQEAKLYLNISRRELVRFLELMDKLFYTKRENDKRLWLTELNI